MNKEQGSIIVYTVLMLTVILTVGLGLMGVFIPKIKTITESISSAVSVVAADSATEMCLYEARYDTNYDDPDSTLHDFRLDNGATFLIEDLGAPGTFIQDDCSTISSSSFNFRAVGNYRGTSRALEISQ